MKLNTTSAIATVVLAALLLPVGSCTKDEPRRHEVVEPPTGPRNEDNGGNDTPENGGETPGNGGSDTPGNGGETPGKSSPIVGEWVGDESDVYFTFDDNFRFEGNLGNGEIRGRYEYLKKFVTEPAQLFLSIETENETRVVELRCRVEDDTMTLLDISGRKWVLTLKKGSRNYRGSDRRSVK